MKHCFTIARRIIAQLIHDRRLLILSVIAPLIVVYLMRIFLKTMPAGFPTGRYVMPLTAFIVHFVTFLQCTIALVKERSSGTLVRMFISGASYVHIITGYTLGYLGLALFVAGATLAESLLLFKLSYSTTVIIQLFGIMSLLGLVSVLLGIFVSSFARNESQVFPIIPLVALPGIFLSGLLVDAQKLPVWALWVGRGFPLYYANNLILEVTKKLPQTKILITNTTALICYGVILLVLASISLCERD